MSDVTNSREAGVALAKSMGLAAHEYEHVVTSLGRLPTKVEIAVFAGMWSEHCSYKSSRPRLAMMPREAPWVLAGPGSHAGAVDVGEGWAVAFKIESHNHPSAVEPYQGAATGVGGILRDVIAQGARPCLVMDSLCFGSPESARTKHLVEGVVAGIAGYGNAIGIPNVGGQTHYDPRYEGNPLVNALAAGLVRHDGMRTARAAGFGNPVLYVGASTGRDGILGAAFASEELGSDTVEKRSHVQVGDPFTGKKLMEACLSYLPEHGMIACQDMGACGLTCAASEMAAAGNVGIDLELETIPVREPGMAAEEILLSESQERFLFVIEKGTEDRAVSHFHSYGVHAVICGHVVPGDRFRARYQGRTVVELPAELVAGGAPMANWPEATDAPPRTPYPAFDAPQDYSAMLCELLRQPAICDQRSLYEHYDSTVGNRTVRGPAEAEAAVQKLPDSHRGFALTINGRGDVCGSDAYLGAKAALAEATRNLACVGAPILAITDGLNNGSPSNPIENRRLTETIRGLADGLRELAIPVTGGNVSLYNESTHGAIPPTPMVGAIGIVEDVRGVPSASFSPGDVVFLLGQPMGEPVHSAYGRVRSGMLVGHAPSVDLALDAKLARFLVAQIGAGRVRAAKDGSIGGLGVALAKLALRGKTGAVLRWPHKAGRLDWALFGEVSGTAWVSVAPHDAEVFEREAQQSAVPVAQVGTTGGTRLTIEGLIDVSLADLARAHAGAKP